MAERSKTVGQALTLLESIRDEGPGTIAELGKRIGISRTAAGRLLISLADHGFARRSDHGFDLGLDLLLFSGHLAAGIRAAAAPTLHDLTASFNETAAIAVRDGDESVSVAQVVPSGRVVGVQYRPGTRHALSVGAHGLAILADIARLEIRDVDPALLTRLAEVARVGYAVSTDELELGVSGIAAPIFGSTGEAVGAIGLVAPTRRFPDVEHVAPSVIQAAREVTKIVTGARSLPPFATPDADRTEHEEGT